MIHVPNVRPRPAREHRIVTELRQQIVGGKLRPGERLPRRVDLEVQFDAATQTVQRAVSRLVRDGFVIAHGKRGTFVVDRPPHLHHYGLVLVGDPTLPNNRGRFAFEAFLYNAVVDCRRNGGRNISTYVAVNNHADSEGYYRLVDHVRAQRVAGLFFDAATYLDQPPLMELLEVPGLPCVTTLGPLQHPNLTSIDLPQAQLIDRTLDYLQARGRQQVGLITASVDDPLFHRFEQGVLDRGMTTHPYWLQSVSPSSARSARNCAHLMMRAPDRPDALLITDDSLVEQATAGLVDAGVRVPRDLEVVAHCNFPYPTPSQVQAKRIGFDVRQVLRTAFELIDRRRRGETVPPVCSVAALFDDELPDSRSASALATMAT